MENNSDQPLWPKRCKKNWRRRPARGTCVRRSLLERERLVAAQSRRRFNKLPRVYQRIKSVNTMRIKDDISQMKTELNNLNKDLVKMNKNLAHQVNRAKTYKKKFEKCLKQRKELAIHPPNVKRVTLRRRHISESSPMSHDDEEVENSIKNWRRHLDDDLFVAKRKLKEYKERFNAAESQRLTNPRYSHSQTTSHSSTPENEKILKQNIKDLENTFKNIEEEEKKKRILLKHEFMEKRKQSELNKQNAEKEEEQRKEDAEKRREAEQVEFEFREKQNKEKLEKIKEVVKNSGLFLSKR